MKSEQRTPEECRAYIHGAKNILRIFQESLEMGKSFRKTVRRVEVMVETLRVSQEPEQEKS